MSNKQTTDEPLTESLVNTLLEAVEPQYLRPERAVNLRARILDRVQRKPDFITVRHQEGVWVTIAPGVSTKLLHRSATAHSFLVRLAPGAAFPAHDHEGEEECLLLEGDATLGEIHATPGDYQVAMSGTRHKTITTQGGALIFVRYGRSAGENRV